MEGERFEVAYIGAAGLEPWLPIHESVVRARLANHYRDVELVLRLMREARTVRTAFAFYRMVRAGHLIHDQAETSDGKGRALRARPCAPEPANQAGPTAASASPRPQARPAASGAQEGSP